MGNESFILLGPGARTALLGLGVATQDCLAKVDWPDALFGAGPLYKGVQLISTTARRKPPRIALFREWAFVAVFGFGVRGGRRASGSRGRASV